MGRHVVLAWGVRVAQHDIGLGKFTLKVGAAPIHRLLHVVWSAEVRLLLRRVVNGLPESD